MAYDFQAALDAAKSVVERQENGGSGSNYTYPLVYPPQGNTITVRLLFNPASGQIVRLVNRHEKVACYRTYGVDCPICQMMQQVKDVTGQDPFGRTKSSRSRGIAFAQFISSTSPIDKGGNRGNLQAGELILLMFPWSVYSQINSIIQAVGQSGPIGMDQAFCHAQQGLFINIQVSQDFKYTTTNVPYMTFNSAENDEAFMKMLDSLENLNEMVLPSQITEEVDKQVKEYADAVYRQYLAPRIPNQAPQQSVPTNFSQGIPQAFQQPAADPGYVPPAPSFSTTPNNFTPQQGQAYPSTTAVPPYVPPVSSQVPPVNPGYVPPAAPAGAPAQVQSDKPACYGNHKSNDPQCICCPVELMCMQPPFDGSPV